ncbi:MAG TPA: conjugative transposon protein TraM [Cyclobacteriaceae bacterium]|nr:conjugative transposon protein TraM [Cyclobacteriaceae bacterium]
MNPHTEKFTRRRRFLMVLPVLALPFLTMIFWALGGGQGSPAAAETVDHAGLNLALPDAHFDEREIWDKLSLYEMAERDSAKYEEARERDPYFDLVAFKSQQGLQQIDTTSHVNMLVDSFPQKGKASEDPNEERVNRKLEELYAEIDKVNARPAGMNRRTVDPTPSDPQFTADVDRLERMMEMMQDNGEADPEMARIESVLEKILDIQHPERVKEKLKSTQRESQGSALPVAPVIEGNDISLINSGTRGLNIDDSVSVLHGFPFMAAQNAFFGLDDENFEEQQSGNAIEAVIHDTQELVSGSTVRMRLLDDIQINGTVIHKDQFIYGVCAINGERLTVKINSLRTGNSLLPVSLEVYDLDGLPGVYIPGAITRDAAKQASDDALQNMQLMSLDPSIGAQAASAGIEAAKGLFSKKAKLIRVTVKAGYRIFLKDSNASQDF